MKILDQMADHTRQVHFGGNWTVSNLKEVLSDVTWQEATAKVADFNTIATLVYHVNYFVCAVATVLKGLPLNASDKLSFDHPPISSAQEWEHFLEQVWKDAEEYSGLIRQLPESLLSEHFSDPKYGTYHRNLLGVIEHTHYHLGQIVILKKLLREKI